MCNIKKKNQSRSLHFWIRPWIVVRVMNKILYIKWGFPVNHVP